MTYDDIVNNKEALQCFHCGSKISFADGKFVVLMSNDGVITVGNPRVGKTAPMIFDSSDCMVYDSHLRFLDRTKKGTFRRNFDQEYNDQGRVPAAFKSDDKNGLVKELAGTK